MPHWTTGEIRTFKAARADGAKPDRAKLYEMFPRHSRAAISVRANKLGLRRPVKRENLPNSRILWLKLAHEHFARREAGLLA